MDSCSPGAATYHVHHVLIQLIIPLRLTQDFEQIDNVQHSICSYGSNAVD